jgi:hypothetical protein
MMRRFRESRAIRLAQWRLVVSDFHPAMRLGVLRPMRDHLVMGRDISSPRFGKAIQVFRPWYFLSIV